LIASKLTVTVEESGRVIVPVAVPPATFADVQST
jgi:hypothetical protein